MLFLLKILFHFIIDLLTVGFLLPFMPFYCTIILHNFFTHFITSFLVHFTPHFITWSLESSVQTHFSQPLAFTSLPPSHLPSVQISLSPSFNGLRHSVPFSFSPESHLPRLHWSPSSSSNLNRSLPSSLSLISPPPMASESQNPNPMNSFWTQIGFPWAQINFPRHARGASKRRCNQAESQPGEGAATGGSDDMQPLIFYIWSCKWKLIQK